MKLSILVPQYNETDEIVKPLLDSIVTQQNVNFDDIEVVIVNDGSDVLLSRELTKSYPFDVRYYFNKHLGVSGTRNYALDNSIGDYVMFCDADDMFLHNCALFIIMRDLKETDCDIFVSQFAEEVRGKDEIIYVSHDTNDMVFIHGKVFKRSYLEQNNIRFNDNLKVHEDVYFVSLAILMANPEKIHKCETQIYLWKWRDNSICREDNDYIIKTHKDLILSNDCLIEQLIKRGRIQVASETICRRIYDTFYSFHRGGWKKKKNK